MNVAAGTGPSRRSARKPTRRSGAFSEDELGSPHDRLPDLADAELVEETFPPMPTGRRAARAVAVQALYEADMTGHPGVAAARRLAREVGLTRGLTEFAEALVARAEADRASLDARIAGAAPVFPTSQLAAIDRSILRIALVELEADGNTPPGVVVNEAVEIAKLFGSEGAPGFVNGVLGSMLR